jgi:2-polyprenyl-3-methyl-5-hydroxy-6-metoxy-1,4-benzoquinol methylase
MDLRELELSITGNKHPWELARKYIIRKLIASQNRKFLKIKGLSNTILDIGCGDAYLVADLSTHHPNDLFLGYDINLTQSQLALLNKNYCHLSNLKIGNNLDSFQDSLQKISHVLLLDVIEHIENDKSFLMEIKNELPGNALFLITVPAFQSLFTSHDTFLGHYRRYTKNQIESLLKESGYEVLKCHYFFSTLVIPRFIKKTLEKKKKNVDNLMSEGISNWERGKFITLLIKIILIIDFLVTELLNKLGIKLPGLSIYCICQPVVS